MFLILFRAVILIFGACMQDISCGHGMIECKVQEPLRTSIKFVSYSSIVLGSSGAAEVRNMSRCVWQVDHVKDMCISYCICRDYSRRVAL